MQDRAIVFIEMDVAQVKPNQLVSAIPSALGNWFAPHQPAAVTNSRGRLEVRSGGRRPPDPDNIGRRGWGMNTGEDKNRDRFNQLIAFRLVPHHLQTHL